MKRRVLRLILVTTMVYISLVGCGGSLNNNESSNNNDSTINNHPDEVLDAIETELNTNTETKLESNNNYPDEVLNTMEMELNTNTETKSESNSEEETETIVCSDDTVITFENPYFELDNNNDGIITYEETKWVNSIRWLEDSFENLKYFPNLTYLILYEDYAEGFETLDGIEVAKSIEGLYIRSNSLKDISAISKLSNLYRLEIEGLSLEDLRIGQSNLKELVIKNVKIKDLKSFTSLPYISYLEIITDSLESLDGLENLVHCSSIFILSNKIKEDTVKEVCERLNIEYVTPSTGGFIIGPNVDFSN